MKKGLSVLLIAAALFGFYGGAVNLNDVLACKDYWEEEGEKSTADMNKLEDGLNQLKDNEQAYLDGLDAVAEGEEALAQGEQDYADGQATLAKGEADYAAAPGKLADARKQIAQGEKDLAAGEDALAAGYAERAAGVKKLNEGEKQKAGLQELVKGFDTIISGYNNSWKPGFEKVQAGRKLFSNTLAGMVGTENDPYQLKKFAAADGVGDFTETYTGALDNIINDEYKQDGKGYEDYISNLTTVINLCPTLDAIRQGTATKLGTLNNVLTAAKDATANAKADKDENDDGVIDENDDEIVRDNAKKSYCNTVNDYSAILKGAAVGDKNEAVLVGAIDTLAGGTYIDTYAGHVNTLANTAYQRAVGAKGSIETLEKNFKSTKEQLEGGISGLNEGQQSMADGARKIATAILGNDTLKSAVKDKMGNSGLALLNALKNNPGLMDTAAGTLSAFQDKMEKAPYNLLTNLQTARGYIAAAVKVAQDALDKGYSDLAAGDKKLAAGEKELAAGKKKLANGKAQYAQGLADYKAAPAKLAAGRAQLAEGLQKLMDGRKELAAGKDKLAEYEDGEQQVRDGLATLMGTEPNGGLESILDRRSGDDDFDNGDKHLDLDEGLDAVDVGRGYQADSGELITKEITNRAIGTAAGLGAAALAVLAAILSFLKKNKGAGVLAILSAAAGGAGIAAGTSAGMEFSSIAGSAVGATPWIAFGILAAVAAVHAIAHFASKEA